MEQSYKIFINDIVVFLVESKKEFNLFKVEGKIVVYNVNKSELLQKIITAVEIGSIKTNLILVSKDLNWLKTEFFKCFKIVIAGGGLVKNDKDEFLMMFRKGKWDLPKGKIEKKEDILEGSVREVEEETNVKIKFVNNKIGLTYHTYNLANKWILKETHWFYMLGDEKSKIKPQKEEGIDEVKWCSIKECKTNLKNTYPSIKDVFKFDK